MIFNSATYLVFLVVTVCLYWTLPQRLRLWMIFLSSIMFYGFWRIQFIPVMLFSVAVDYFAALGISRATEAFRKKIWLGLSLVLNLGLLFYFKYLLFFAENASGLLHMAGLQIDPFALKIILPLGISFYTFQTISYTVDVYRGFIHPERDFVLYGCYVTFFPQLVAGPILRAREIMAQLEMRATFDLAYISEGLRRILYGLFLKVVLADNIAPLVDTGFAQPTAALSALDVWTLAFLFGFQIYFDFSAYSHIALGSARLMGISFPENFNFPYAASSPRDFWKRWHISLSSWIRDYLYLPLAGAKVHDRSVGGLATAASNLQFKSNYGVLFLTWALMGLWHGANWTFLAWGLYHACLIFGYRQFSTICKDIPVGLRNAGGWVVTLPLVMLGWIPFRASSLWDFLAMWRTVLQGKDYFWLGLRENTYLVAALLLAGFFITSWAKKYFLPLLRQRIFLSQAVETVAFSVIIGLVFVFLRPISQFIYFQF